MDDEEIKTEEPRREEQPKNEPEGFITGRKNPRGRLQFLNIIGQIEGHVLLPAQNKSTKYEHVIPQLFTAAEDPEIDGLLILLNTVGGDVEAGLALSELIANLGKPTVSLVIGGGHSIGVPLAVSAAYSFIAPSATMTIHPVRINGTIVGAPQTFDYFNKTQERIIEFIARNSNISKARIDELMLDTSKLALDVGTILIGEEAVREGIINSVGGLRDAMEKLYEMVEELRGSGG
ncbi:MAG: ATP-dependent Clp protease proteolytic subunit [Clostridiales bacterium]|jgi:ATP-dependent protease ClpP protease subunit|nr:ATP-dependent Clp protease proteolytic subunit [Clostridiales bacterium]